MIAINAADEHAGEINDVADIEKYYPGTVSGIREWFRWYILTRHIQRSHTRTRSAHI